MCIVCLVDDSNEILGLIAPETYQKKKECRIIQMFIG